MFIIRSFGQHSSSIHSPVYIYKYLLYSCPVLAEISGIMEFGKTGDTLDKSCTGSRHQHDLHDADLVYSAEHSHYTEKEM